MCADFMSNFINVNFCFLVVTLAQLYDKRNTSSFLAFEAKACDYLRRSLIRNRNVTVLSIFVKMKGMSVAQSVHAFGVGIYIRHF